MSVKRRTGADAVAAAEFGTGYLRDKPSDVSAVAPNEAMVGLRELVELIGGRKRTIREAMKRMGAPTRRIGRGGLVVVPIGWVRAHILKLFALKPKRKPRL